MISLIDKTFVILGLRMSGKSTLANKILNECGSSALYYDTLGESPPDVPFDFYVPADRNSPFELEKVIAEITPKTRVEMAAFIPKYRMVIIDESNRFCPPKPHPLPPRVAELNDQGRHYRMSVGFIARRPTQLNSDLIELADYIFVFRLTGQKDLAYLEATVEGLREAVTSLDEHAFVLVHPNKSFEICRPIKADQDWLRKVENERKRID